MKKNSRKSSPSRNRRLVMAETALTAAVMSSTIMGLFYKSIGMDEFQVTLSQIAYTLAIMLLNIPLGYVADRFSRKGANAIGDIICAVSLLLYARANSFFDVVACEFIFGIGSGFSQGVDSSLLQHFCHKEKGSNEKAGEAFYALMQGKSSTLCQISSFIIILSGSPFTSNYRFLIAISSIPLWIGAILSLIIADDSEKIQKGNNRAATSMISIVRKNLHRKDLMMRVFAYIITREITHPIVFIYPYLLNDLGVKVATFSLYWCAGDIFSLLGTCLGRKANVKLREWQRFVIPVAIITFASLTMFLKLTRISIMLYFLFYFVKGWTSATMLIGIKRLSDKKESTTVESMARCMSQFFYIISLAVVGFAARIDHKLAFIATIALFVPPAIVTAKKLYKSEKDSF